MKIAKNRKGISSCYLHLKTETGITAEFMWVSYRNPGQRTTAIKVAIVVTGDVNRWRSPFDGEVPFSCGAT
jgi:hypothetical protein